MKTKIKQNELTIGSIAAAMSVLMYVTSLEVLLSNLSGDTAIFWQPVATACSGMLWTVYGFSREDKMIFYPSMLAFLLGIVTAMTAF